MARAPQESLPHGRASDSELVRRTMSGAGSSRRRDAAAELRRRGYTHAQLTAARLGAGAETTPEGQRRAATQSLSGTGNS